MLGNALRTVAQMPVPLMVALVMRWLADGRVLPAGLVVWAAGVKAPDFLRDFAGLETSRLNQLVVQARVGQDVQAQEDERERQQNG